MIEAKEIIHRDYVDRTCVGFTYKVPIEGKKPLIVLFEREDENVNLWSVQMSIETQHGIDTYAIGFMHPAARCSLEAIAAYGLKILQGQLQLEIQDKMAIDFAIGDATEGM